MPQSRKRVQGGTSTDQTPASRRKKATSRTPTKAAGKTKKKADWRYSDARQLIAQDMMDGIVPINETIKDPEKLYNELYAELPEFEDFPYDKKLFATRLKSLQATVSKLQGSAKLDIAAFARDRAIFPLQTHAPNGRKNWEGSEADRWLKVDMNSGLHEHMAPSELYATRTCYSDGFSLRRFTKRIDQLRESDKPFGATPGQSKNRKLIVRGIKEKSRRLTIDPFVNKKDSDENDADEE